jgi:hypothetical protein
MLYNTFNPHTPLKYHHLNREAIVFWRVIEFHLCLFCPQMTRKKTSSIVERIHLMLDHYDLSKSTFYGKVGLSNGFLDKVTNIGSDKIEKILAGFPEIASEWLVMGTGPMFKTEKQRDQDESGSLIRLINSGNAGLLPQQADNFKFIKELPTFRFPLPQFNNGEYALFELAKDIDSMYPTILQGDWVFGIRMNDYKDIHDGYLYVIVTKAHGVVCKRVINKIEENFCLILTSDNLKYKPYSLPVTEILQVWKVEYKLSAVMQSSNNELLQEMEKMKRELGAMQQALKNIS